MEPAPTLLLIPSDGASTCGLNRTGMKPPKWASNLWSASPMDHKQLAAHMVCSWGLVMAYRQTHQNVYVCLPTPHVLEAYNHKINHDMHKELTMQEHTVIQYTHALQYVSYCNDERYESRLAPVVKQFWAEVVEPFGSWALHNLDPSHLLVDMMHPNWGTKIPDYRVWEHIAFICAAFFQGIESHSQYEQRRKKWEEHWETELSVGDNWAHSCSPSKRNQEWDEQGSGMGEPKRRSQSKSRPRWDRRGWQSRSRRRNESRPQRTSPLMTRLTHIVRGYPLHLNACSIMYQRSLKYLKWNPFRLLLGMPWKDPVSPHYHGRSRSKRKSNNRKVQPKAESNLEPDMPPPSVQRGKC